MEVWCLHFSIVGFTCQTKLMLSTFVVVALWLWSNYQKPNIIEQSLENSTWWVISACGRQYQHMLANLSKGCQVWTCECELGCKWPITDMLTHNVFQNQGCKETFWNRMFMATTQLKIWIWNKTRPNGQWLWTKNGLMDSLSDLP